MGEHGLGHGSDSTEAPRLGLPGALLRRHAHAVRHTRAHSGF